MSLISRFKYPDTRAYRYGLKGIERSLENEIVAVIGVGGSGSYLVDILAKTNIKELHMFDDDFMEVHNAFRIAGAAQAGELDGTVRKVKWHEDRYGAIRAHGLIGHTNKVGSAGVDLTGFNTIFIAVDDLDDRRMIQTMCNQAGVFHIAVGLAVEIEGENNDQLGGMVRVETAFAPRQVKTPDPNGLPAPPQIYGRVQTAELNMLSAALAVVEWKTELGIYRNERDKYDSLLFSSTTGQILQAQFGEDRDQ